MSGIVFRPPSVHTCAPGWEWKPVEPDDGLPGTHYGVPPSARSHPRGTVWECDCGTRWISRGVIGHWRLGALGGGVWLEQLEWEREGWFARWRRLRRHRTGSEGDAP